MTTPKRIYFDHAATTPMDQEVLEEMIPFFKEDFGNPSGAHRIAQKSQAALSRYREMAANALNSKPREIIFTSGGSESDNLAIRGIMWNARREGKGNHVVSSVAEHPAVLNTLAQLSDIYGFEKTLVGVDAKGRVDPEEIKDAVKKDTVLISLLLVSHESGAIQPIEKVAQISGDKGIPLHCDAAQAGRFLDLDVKKLGIDLLSVSGHKLYGPKGVGLLYIKEGRSLLPQITGGPQEGGIRAGTENLPLIAGFARALEICGENRQKESDQLVLLRDYLFEKIRGTLSEVKLVGELETSLPGI
ncbi:MAG: cysteine desulfurase, partial [Deltaproteobacteria bacterium]|nr:cysteine desulfurase [Deltaproteobacteria bacterium]